MIEDLLEQHTPEVADLTLRLREVIRTAMPDAGEKVYQGWHGVGFHHPDAGYVCAIFPGDDHVRVGFEHGHLLPDPYGLFDSGGEQVRYITVDQMTPDLAQQLQELIDHAVHVRNRK
jgi:hypothetical protein